MQKHFVTFYSPGTFMSEQSSKPIATRDVRKAVEMAADISDKRLTAINSSMSVKPLAGRFNLQPCFPDRLDRKWFWGEALRSTPR